MTNGATIWHAGERALHGRLGIAARMEQVGHRAIRRFMPEQHRAFFGQLPFIVTGSKDDSGQLWASMLTGKPGFISSPSPTLLDIHAAPVSGDPLAEAIMPGRALATLGIELPTRRRNRANGKIIAADNSGFILEVAESFGNCPKYIVRRDYLPEGPAAGRPAAMVQQISGLNPSVKKLIQDASTFFVASSGLGEALPDVSHRGGMPGFVKITGETLTVPDYAGNLFFNTLGNFLVNPLAGLLFLDFEAGDLLQLTGTTELKSPEPGDGFVPGEGSSWDFHVTGGRWQRNAFMPRFGEGEISPFSPAISA